MNKFLLSLFLLCNLSLSAALAQKSATISTTPEEYAYLTKGYKMQLEGGLDMKQGYVLEDVMEHNHKNFHFEAKALFRSGNPKPCAHLISLGGDGTETEYYCLPTFSAGSDLWSKFYQSIGLESHKSPERTEALVIGLSKLAALNGNLR